MPGAYVTLRFTSKGHLGSHIAALLAQSRDFNHCMVIHDGIAYEAVLSGVRAVPVEVSMKGVVRYQDMRIWIPDIEAMRAFGRSQVGKGYDWFGAIGLPLLRSGDWQSDSRWWCSEYNFAMLGAGGVWMLDPSEQEWVTPNDLFMCNYERSSMVHVGVA